MANLTLGGRSFAIAPFKLRELRLAAPHIDHVNNVAGSLTTFAGMTESARSIIEILAIGVNKIDPTLDADALEELASMEDMTNLQAALKELMEESGLSKGEAPASVPAEAESLETRSNE